MRIGLLITAGGSGVRFGQVKQFVVCDGKPLIVHTLACFHALSDSISACVVTCHPDHVQTMRTVLDAHPQPFPIQVVAGGASRADSVYQGVQAFGVDIDTLCIHDAVRPCVSPHLLDRLIAASSSHSAVIPGIPVTDTIKQVAQDQVQETLPRNSLIAVQTPQFFHKRLLEDIYQDMFDAGSHLDAMMTDESFIVEKAGHSVYVVSGEQSNIKVTYPDDLLRLNSIFGRD